MNEQFNNPNYHNPPQPQEDQVQVVKRSIRASLLPRLNNNKRLENLHILENIKAQHDAPYLGYDLASSVDEPDPVRYFGLQLMEHSVKYRWAELKDGEIAQLGKWVKVLAGTIRVQDPLFLRNKIAALWVEMSKRCWGQEWMNMDKELLDIWTWRDNNEQASAWLVCYILEMLSEDICVHEDPTAGLRLDILGKSLNEIMVTDKVFQDHLTTRGTSAEVRASDDNGGVNGGWLSRLTWWVGYMAQRLSSTASPPQIQARDTQSILKALQALRPTASWINFRSVLEADTIKALAAAFSLKDVKICLAVVEVMLAFLSRTTIEDTLQGSTQDIVVITFQSNLVEMIDAMYDITYSAPGGDDDKYTLQSKMSEALSMLAECIAAHPRLIYSEIPVGPFFNLMAKVLQSKSLTVSIPVLHSWTKVLACQNPKLVEIVAGYLGSLLQTSSERLLRYEVLPEDSDDETLQHLYEDFDQAPERHAFIGNYRRFCMSVIETLSLSRPVQALEFTLGQMKSMLAQGPYGTDRGFDPVSYSPVQLSVLQLDAQASVVAAALKGYSRWLRDSGALSADEQVEVVSAEKAQAAAVQYLQQWTMEICNMQIDDPEVAQHTLATLVAIIRTVHNPENEFVLHVVQYILTKRLHNDPSHAKYMEAVKGFEHLRVLELQKLALIFSTPLLDVYGELELKVATLVQELSEDAKIIWSYRAFLFIIIHRAAGIAKDVRLQRLQDILRPVYEAWQDPNLSSALSDFESFRQALDLGDLPQFYSEHGFDQVQDWHNQILNDAGKAKQKSINDRIASLPLRATKSLLAASTERTKEGSKELEIACALWAEVIPAMLPNLLGMIKQATAFNNMWSWKSLPDNLQVVLKRTLQDRFWQSGITSESKEAFLARVAGSKDSYEGFASTVRGATRNVREHAYHMLYMMATFEEQFFGVPNFGAALADALFEDAHALSTNHLQNLINLTTGLVRRCPPHHVHHFLPPVLKALFTKLDAKITAEWDTIREAGEREAEGDELTDEMRTESTLRQLTFSMTSFVPFLLAFGKQPGSGAHANGPPPSPIRAMVLSDPAILEPMMMFCTHALQMRDTRCCTTVTKVFRDLIPTFKDDAPPAPQVREFICTEVLKACITSIHDPYFHDIQRDLATVIANMLVIYFDKTETPARILMSLPNMSVSAVTDALNKLRKTASERQQRAIVLSLLEAVRGLSIYESGSVAKTPVRSSKAARSGMMAQFMQMDQDPTAATINKGDESTLEGIADLFGS
ncbi:hypothetical protein MBLNU230_g7163t1 [Neophaeotheca triangularis]